MPSRVDYLSSDFDTVEERSFPVRSAIEWTLRAISLIILVFLIWQAFHQLRRRPTGHATGTQIQESLIRWSTRESPDAVHVRFDSVPSPEYRDWLAAFPAAGTEKSWEGATLQPTAVTVEPIVDPKNAVRVWVAAPNNSVVTIHDTLGVIDSLAVESGGAVLVAPRAEGLVRATVDGTTATVELRDSLKVKSVLVLGNASWEGKFIMASLEEHGWKADGRFSIGLPPKNKKQGVVIQGPAEPKIDTSVYAAVIVLDSSAAKYAGAITNYVRQGGGLIVTGYAAPLPAFASITPSNNVTMPDGLMEEPTVALDSMAPRAVLQLAPLRNLKPTAIAVEMQKNNVAAAAWRVGQGRVLQVGYIDTWQWRMGGIGETPAAYRGWWSTMVSSVAYAPRFPRVATNAVEPTPMASLVSILGTPKAKAAEASNFLDDPRLLPALFTILMLSLLGEWASRRLRGRP